MLTLREARRDDVNEIAAYIRELAEFEQLSHECWADAAQLAYWLFGPNPRAYCLMAEWDGKPAGFALYFYNFSTFLTRPGIYIEDVFVRPQFRRKGIARAIFRQLAQQALAEGCGRLEWWVLDWNRDAIAAYESMGAVAMDAWTVQRISGESLEKLAQG